MTAPHRRAVSARRLRLRVASSKTNRAIRLAPHRRPAEMAGPCHGFTLLEIILALAILAGSLVALGEVMRLGDQVATLTEGETQAQILAASVMEELVSGARQLSTVNQVSLDEESDPPWLYSVDVQNTDFNELVAVRVSVEQQLDERLQPARFELVRWMPNPDYDATTATEESSSSSTTSSTSGAGSSSGGSSTGASSSGSGGGTR